MVMNTISVECAYPMADRTVKYKLDVSKDMKKVRVTVSSNEELTFDDIRDAIDQLESATAEESGQQNH